MSALYDELLHRKIIDMNNFDKVNPYKIETLMHHCVIWIDRDVHPKKILKSVKR